MNEFPEFQSGQPALEQLSAARLNLVSLGQKSNQIQPGNGYRVTQTPGGTTLNIIRKRNPQPINPPFLATLRKVGDNWEITMEPGSVIARRNGSGDAVTIWDVTSIPTNDSPLTVIDGDKVWVQVTESDQGVVSYAAISSGQALPESIAPSLIGGDNASGTEGTRIYHVATFTAYEEDPNILYKQQILTGHLEHFQPTLSENALSAYSTGTGGRILKAWNASFGRFNFRGISKANGKLTIDEVGDEVQIRGNKIAANVKVLAGDASDAEPSAQFDDGLLLTGNEREGNEDPVVQPADILIRVPTVVASVEANAQIQVIDIGTVGNIYEVSGNDIDGDLAYSIDGGTAEPFATVKDGLISEILGVIPIPAAGGSGLPSGSAGDMLYHNGTDWVVLANPGAPATHFTWVIQHDGTDPDWKPWRIRTVSICISGTPTDVEILSRIPL